MVQLAKHLKFMRLYSGSKKTGARYLFDISATRLSLGDPVGFPSHPCEWFSIIVYQRVDNDQPSGFCSFKCNSQAIIICHTNPLRFVCIAGFFSNRQLQADLNCQREASSLTFCVINKKSTPPISYTLSFSMCVDGHHSRQLRLQLKYRGKWRSVRY